MKAAVLASLDYPCFEQWSPRTCRPGDQATPLDHVCRIPRLYPHVCRCSACGHTGGGTGWLVLTSCPVCRPATGYYCSAHR